MDEIDWNAVFWLHIPVVVAALIGLRVVPDSRDARGLGLDIPGAVLATGGLIALVFGIIQGNEAGWLTAPEIVVAFVLAIVLLGSFVYVELRSEQPMLPLRFFRQRDFTGAVIVIGLAFFAMFGVFFFLAQFFQLVQGRSALHAGLLIVPAALGMMVSSLLAGLLSQIVGPKPLGVASMLLILFGMVLFTQLEADTSVLYIIASIFLFDFGAGLGMPALTDTVMAVVPVDDAGIGSAVNDVSRGLGGALGIAITGAVVNRAYSQNVEDELAGVASAEVVESVSDGIGVATLVAAELRSDGDAVLAAASIAFVDAIALGFIVGIVFMVLAAVVAAALLPRHMREDQAAEHRSEQLRQPEAFVAGDPVTAVDLEEQCSQEPIDRFVQHCVGYDFNPWVRANG